jgi:hypothetical protein
LNADSGCANGDYTCGSCLDALKLADLCCERDEAVFVFECVIDIERIHPKWRGDHGLDDDRAFGQIYPDVLVINAVELACDTTLHRLSEPQEHIFVSCK